MNTFVRDAIPTVLTLTLNELILLSHGKYLKSGISHKRDPVKVLSQLERKKLPVVTLNKIKLNNDLKELIDTYLDTLAELQSNGTIKKLRETINRQGEQKKKEEKLIEDHKSIISALRSLKAKLTEFKSEAENKILQISETLNNLKSDWRVINKINELECELVRKWEHTRFTQATILGERDEENLKRELSAWISKTEAEKRVICDFQAYSKQQFDKYSKSIKMWKERYSKEMDELLVSVAEKEQKIKEVHKTYEKHFEIDCQRKKFLEEYLEQRAEQNRLMELQMKRIDSAISIQAWWRGVMVRRCLGPYRNKAKKGKKGKKSK